MCGDEGLQLSRDESPLSWAVVGQVRVDQQRVMARPVERESQQPARRTIGRGRMLSK